MFHIKDRQLGRFRRVRWGVVLGLSLREVRKGDLAFATSFTRDIEERRGDQEEIERNDLV